MPPTSISLVMPNHNHARYLPRSVGAVLRQTREADQILILDDASTDESVAVIGRLTAGAGNVTLLRNLERQGVLKALNKALARATGDFVAFPSADDMIFPAFLEKAEAQLRRHPEAAFCCARAVLVDDQEASIGERPLMLPSLRQGYVPPEQARKLLEGGDNFFLGAVALYRRDRLMNLGGFDEQLGPTSDGIVQRRLAVRHGFCFIPEILGYWRIDGRNYSVTNNTDPERLQTNLERARDVIAREHSGLFPERYTDKLEARLRFGAARLLLLSPDLTAEHASRLAALIQARPGEARAIASLLKMRRLGRPLILAWLAIRLHPFSLRWLVREPLRKWWADAPVLVDDGNRHA